MSNEMMEKSVSFEGGVSKIGEAPENAEEKINREKFMTTLTKMQKALKEYNGNPQKYAEKISKANKWMEKNCYLVLMSDPSYYLEKGIDSIFWKERFYKPIEIERSKLKEDPASQGEHGPRLLALIEEGVDYYTFLFQKVKQVQAIESSKSSSTLFSQHTKIILTHFILIHLGDLQRYKVELQNASPRDHAYSEAETFYKQAIAFDPTNGDGHHKLAVIASNCNCDYLALYRYCRALGCRTPYLSSLKNVKLLFTRNEKELKNFGNPEKVTNWKDNRELFLSQFISLQYHLFSGLPTEDAELHFMRLLNSCISRFSSLLRIDCLPTSTVYRLVMIAIFAAGDGWVAAEGEKSQSTALSTECYYAWILLYSMMSCIERRTAVPSLHDATHAPSLRHIPTLSIFTQWFELQKQNAYRPRYMASDVYSSFSAQPQRLALFQKAEQRFWTEMVEVLNRLPLTTYTAANHAPLVYEVETRGYTPFQGIFDRIPHNTPLCGGEEATIRYMQNVCVTLNRIFIDPRCPVQITKTEDDRFTAQYNSLNSVMNFTSFDIDEPSTFGPTSRANLGFEDELSFAGMPSMSGYHSRQISSLSHMSLSSTDLHGSRSSSQSQMEGNRLRLGSNHSNDALGRMMSPLSLEGSALMRQ
ncbi:hypothetical protein WA577_005674 [Blastocystis sp. JDR]